MTNNNYVIADANYISSQLVADESNDFLRRYPLRNRIPRQATGFRICAVTHKDTLICPTITQALKSSDEQIKLWRQALMVELKTLYS